MKKHEFFEAFRCNDDGAGFSWYTSDGMISWKKGIMAVKDAWDFYETIETFPHICHFRKGDPTVPELTHPFICDEGSPLALEGTTNKPLLFHNGGISFWKDKFFSYVISRREIPEGHWSDTRLLACLYHDLGKRIMEFVDGKFAVMSTTGIENYGSFDEDNKILYSNNTYKVYSQQVTTYNHFKNFENDENYMCLCSFTV